MRRQVLKILKPLDAIPVENPICPGTADVNYIEGWIELKWLPKWPKNSDLNPVKIDHFTEKQRNRIKTRKEKGGNIHLLLKVGKEWLLFDGAEAHQYVGRVTKSELKELSCGYWKTSLNREEFKKCLMK